MIKKITFIFSLHFKTMFTKHSSGEILNLNFEKMTVYLTAIFRLNGPPLLHQKGYNDVIYLECSVWTQQSCKTRVWESESSKFRLGNVLEIKFRNPWKKKFFDRSTTLSILQKINVKPCKRLKRHVTLFLTDVKCSFLIKYGQLEIQFSLAGSAWELKSR